MDVDPGTGLVGPREIAAGPVAGVYAGTHPESGVNVAVKLFSGKLDRGTATAVERERRVLSSAHSRSLLPFDEIVEQDGRCGVRMELCRTSLAALLDSPGASRPTVLDVLAIGAAVTSGLAAAHEAGIVHGGVTPHNVLYRYSGEIVLADCGLSLRERFPRDPAHAVDHTAPETLSDDVRSPATDLYGLGAVLHLALTGSSPFPRRTGQTNGERILQVLRRPVPPIEDPGVPAELSRLVGALLNKEPDARRPDAAALARWFGDQHRRLSTPAADSMWARPPGTPELRIAGTPGIPAAQAADDVESIAANASRDTEWLIPHRCEPLPEPGHTAGSMPTDAAPSIPAPTTPAPPRSAPVPALHRQPTPPLPPPPGQRRTLVHTASGPPDEDERPRQRRHIGMFAGIGAVVLAVTVGALLIRGGVADDPAPEEGGEARAPGVARNDPPAPRQEITLDTPADRQTEVELTWRAKGELDFAVVVAGEGIETMVLVARRDTSMRVPVDPARMYCFQIRGTDNRTIYTSEPKPIRGAECTL